MESLTASRAGTVAPPPVATVASPTVGVVAPPAMTMKVMSDERLARLAAKGSEAAFAAIFERHHQALHRYCQSILGNGHDAADALQNTMVKALRALPGETRQIALKPWLYRIAHNESISLLRARRPDSDLDAAAHLGDLGTERLVESREHLRDLSADLQELTEQQRGALLLRELSGLEFTDVAGALAISAAAAKQSVYEARCALQSMAEGRAMGCDVVRRALSDGDKRTLRAMKMLGHLRACAGCRDFQTALHQRPAQLAALAPPLPLALAATMLHGILGGAGHSSAGGGGLTVGLTAGVKAGGAFSLGAKFAAVAVIAGSVAGGAVYVAPSGPATPTGPSLLPRNAARHDGRTVAIARRAARRVDGVVSLRLRNSPRERSTTKASTPTATTTADKTSGVAGRQPALTGPAAPSIAASRRPQPAAPAGRTPARGSPAAGVAPDRATQRPTQSTKPAPAAATSRPAAATSAPSAPPAPVTAPSPVTAPAPAASAAPAVSAPVGSAPIASDNGSAGAVAPPRPR